MKNIIIIVLILMLIGLFYKSYNTDETIKRLESKNDSIEVVNSSLADSIEYMDNTISLLEDSIQKSNDIIEKKELKIKKTIKYYEKVRNDITDNSINDKVIILSRKLK